MDVSPIPKPKYCNACIQKLPFSSFGKDNRNYNDGNKTDDEDIKTEDDDHQGWNETKFEYAISRILAKVKKEFEDAHGGSPIRERLGSYT